MFPYISQIHFTQHSLRFVCYTFSEILWLNQHPGGNRYLTLASPRLIFFFCYQGNCDHMRAQTSQTDSEQHLYTFPK